MRIDGRDIGPGHPPYVVAEISGEHKGDRYRALDLIKAAKNAGADAAKLQCFDPIRLAEARGGRHKLLTEGLWAGRTLGDLYQETHTPRAWFPELFDYASRIGITLFASVFDPEDVDFLEALGCPSYKISSFEIEHLALIRKAAATEKPLIISDGVASLDDIRAAHAAATSAGGKVNLAWLYCVSAYPAPIDHMCLKHGLEHIDEEGRPLTRCEDDDVVLGLSDHSCGNIAAIVATALGASIIEKHITLSRSDGGPDASFSLEPHEFAKLVADVKDAYASLGTGERPAAEDTYRSLRRSA